MNQKRPVNLELSTLHFPIMAITSILHRLSGIAVFLLLPFMLYLLQQSLHSPESFASLQTYIQCNFVKFLIWGFISSLFYHFMAGVRHMIADLGYGETVDTARKTAVVLLVLTVVSTIGLGVWIW
jgi:succinate dehydrogenase / fumarate reductase cytochrome b subunit